MEDDIKHLKQNQNKPISNRISSEDGKNITSFGGIKNEIIGIFSINGYSHMLGTSNFFKKIFSLLCMITLFVACTIFVNLNIQSYRANEVVTTIKNLDDEQLIFPAITFCLIDTTQSAFTSPSLGQVFTACYFDTTTSPCKFDEFGKITIYDPVLDITYQCYKFNGGRDSLNNEIEILSTQKVGYYGGLTLELNVNTKYDIYYYVGDNKVQPTNTEMQSTIQIDQKGKYVSVPITKVVDTKLPMPYSNCSDMIGPGRSHLVEKILQQNVTYRQKNCYEMCFNEYLSTYVLLRNISKTVAWSELDFDYKGNCSKICPLECSSTSFEIQQIDASWSDALIVNFYYTDRKYTEISQVVKTTGAEFVSNTGGILGLFLDLSFFHAYRFIFFIFDCIYA